MSTAPERALAAKMVLAIPKPPAPRSLVKFRPTPLTGNRILTMLAEVMLIKLPLTLSPEVMRVRLLRVPLAFLTFA